ncbi:uncharacterized protein LOC133742966 isoform X2 [Rosa rugosa]|uniref:uncharacterized protein LOC133742966 isoform X2 n=1 Tax=Rosa rugosa TaxID=74645 RepID=UPI002B40F18A|nr:uncharacterized protein LOC133742966 isoform X2 [Rosa rugosa]
MSMKGESSSKQGEEISVFVLVTTFEGDFHGALFEVKLDRRGQVMGGCGATQPPLLDPIARFFEKDCNIPEFYTFGGVCICNKLYLLLSSGSDIGPCNDDDDEITTPKKPDSLNGYIFDIKTRALVKFSPPKASKSSGTVIHAYEKIYFLLDPFCFPCEPEDSFERYDPINDSWESLKPFPYSEDWATTKITGHAVYDGSILFSIYGRRQPAVMAYHEKRDYWEPVKVEDFCWSGKALVVGNTMYALSLQPGEVIAFSVITDQTDEGHAAFSLGKPLLLSGMEIKFPPNPSRRSQYLAHLGGLEFCLVQSGFTYKGNYRQPLSITTFRIEEGNNIKILHSAVRDVDIEGFSGFLVSFCFTHTVLTLT